MIKLERTEVMNFDNAVRGMRNPMESYAKSDSYWGCYPNSKQSECGELCINDCDYIIGENDLALMRKLAAAGSDHRKFLRQIMVSVDITAPRYWWAEFDTYKIGTVANSCSTMHTIHKRDLKLSDFSLDGLTEKSQWMLNKTIQYLNAMRMAFVDTEDKKYWRQLIMLLPQNFNQMRTVTLNYEVLLNQYLARKNHKLSEWLDYCEWVESLPYFKEICLNDSYI